MAKLVDTAGKLSSLDKTVLMAGVRLADLERSPYGLSVVQIGDLVEAIYAQPDVRNVDDVARSLIGLSGESWDDPAAMVRPWGNEKDATWFVFNARARDVVNWMTYDIELAEHTGPNAALGL